VIPRIIIYGIIIIGLEFCRKCFFGGERADIRRYSSYRNGFKLSPKRSNHYLIFSHSKCENVFFWIPPPPTVKCSSIFFFYYISSLFTIQYSPVVDRFPLEIPVTSKIIVYLTSLKILKLTCFTKYILFEYCEL